MASALFTKGKQGFLDGSIDWDTNTINAALIDMNDAGPAAGAWTLDSVSASGSTLTCVTNANHGLAVGDVITIFGTTGGTNINNTVGVPTFTVATENSTTGFTCTSSLSPSGTTTTDTGYIVNLSKTDKTGAYPAGAVVAEVALGTKGVTDGVASAANSTLSAVTGDVCEAILIYQTSTERLIAHIDNATGLPVTPNGGDIVISWDTGPPANIFRL